MQIPDDTLVEFNEDIPLWMSNWIGKDDGKYPPPVRWRICHHHHFV